MAILARLAMAISAMAILSMAILAMALAWFAGFEAPSYLCQSVHNQREKTLNKCLQALLLSTLFYSILSSGHPGASPIDSHSKHRAASFMKKLRKSVMHFFLA